MRATPLPPTMQALMLPAPGGYRLAVRFAPAAAARGSVLLAPPFAEEMNKSRRMLSRQARALAAIGYDVLIIDLLGTGDSSGDFGDASWTAWIDDLALGWQWLTDRAAGPVWLWGLRSGALLASALATRLATGASVQPQVPPLVQSQVHPQVNPPAAPPLLLWQPVLSGSQHLQQFLRLRAMSGLGAERDPANGVSALKQALARGETVEIAGYALSPALADGLAQATLSVPPAGTRVIWLEVAGGGELTLPSATRIEQWRAAGVNVTAQACDGAPFWQTQEIEESELLLAATTEALAR